MVFLAFALEQRDSNLHIVKIIHRGVTVRIIRGRLVTFLINIQRFKTAWYS